MDLNHYAQRLEGAYEDDGQLQQIQADADADQGLSDDDKRMIVGRAGNYRADINRGLGEAGTAEPADPAGDVDDDEFTDDEDEGASS